MKTYQQALFAGLIGGIFTLALAIPPLQAADGSQIFKTAAAVVPMQ